MSRVFVRTSSEGLFVNTAPLASDTFSFFCWWKPTDTNDRHTLLWMGDKDVSDQYHACYGDNDAALEVNVRSGGSNVLNAVGTYTADEWNSALYVSAASDDRSLYLNNGTAGTDSTNVSPTGRDRVAIGYHADSSPGVYSDCSIAHWTIWNVALTSADAAVLEKYSPLFVKPQSIVQYRAFFRNDNSRHNQDTLTEVGTPTFSGDNPPIIMPSAQVIPFPVVAGGTIRRNPLTGPFNRPFAGAFG